MAESPITLTVSKTREPLKKQLNKLADRLGCRITDLVWVGIAYVVKNPPKTAPISASKPIGRASGFWVVHVRKGTSKKVSAVEIREVEARHKLSGRAFYRYKRDDAKSRERALNQAKQSAAYDSELVGLTATVKIFALAAAKKVKK